VVELVVREETDENIDENVGHIVPMLTLLLLVLVAYHKTYILCERVEYGPYVRLSEYLACLVLRVYETMIQEFGIGVFQLNERVVRCDHFLYVLQCQYRMAFDLGECVLAIRASDQQFDQMHVEQEHWLVHHALFARVLHDHTHLFNVRLVKARMNQFRVHQLVNYQVLILLQLEPVDYANCLQELQVGYFGLVCALILQAMYAILHQMLVDLIAQLCVLFEHVRRSYGFPFV